MLHLHLSFMLGLECDQVSQGRGSCRYITKPAETMQPNKNKVILLVTTF